MLYMLRAGVLYHQTHILADIKGRFSDPEKKIFAADGTLLFQTAIHTMNAPPGKNGDVRFREYRLLNPDGSIYATARPGYLTQDDPDVVGWPLCRKNSRAMAGASTWLAAVNTSSSSSGRI